MGQTICFANNKGGVGKTTTCVAIGQAWARMGKKVLFVLPEKNDIIYRSARNIAGVKTTLVGTLNVYDILNCDTVVVLKDAVSKIEEVYA